MLKDKGARISKGKGVPKPGHNHREGPVLCANQPNLSRSGQHNGIVDKDSIVQTLQISTNKYQP